MIERLLQRPLENDLRTTRKVAVLYGPRRVGKTTLLQWLRDRMPGRGLVLNGDFLDDHRLLQPERASLARLTSGLDWLFLDEAQNFPDVGACLKLLHDEHSGVRVLATGSSSFDLTSRAGEPLTGRQIRRVLYPVSFAELRPDPTSARRHLEHALVYGTYPELLAIESHDAKVENLRQLAADYLLKDIFRQIDVNRAKLIAILRLLAFQIGSEVSLSEIGRQVDMDVKTVSRYLHFLEEAFVLFRLGGFSRNLRKEIAKSQKIFFVDLGIRNAILQAFQPLPLRSDVGALFENFMVIERRKKLEYAGIQANHWFWRTYSRQEIDLIEEVDGKLSAFEFKYSASDRARLPPLWRETYPDSQTRIVSAEDTLEFLV